MKQIYRAGALSLVVLALAGSAASAQTVTLLHGFTYQTTKGHGDVSALTVDRQGVLYGTTHEGGTNGYGTIFKLTPPASDGAAWKHTVIHSFCAQSDCADGSYPSGGLNFDAAGALYGTTESGGDACGELGCGTVFKLSPPAAGHTRWTHAVIHHFRPFPSGPTVVDGTNPSAGLIGDSNGVLYGTTEGGGLYGKGTVFRLAPPASAGAPWKESVINVFGGSEIGDGKDPKGGLAFDEDGAIYGTTYEGGAKGDYGTVFKLTPPANVEGLWPETVLYSFSNGSDGGYPKAGLLFVGNHRFYGTTYEGGNQGGYGTVFTFTAPADGPAPVTTIHSFGGADPYNNGQNDGVYPMGRLIVGVDGAIYGTTYDGGFSGQCDFFDACGTIFSISGSDSEGWTETVVHRFCDVGYKHFCFSGANPTAGLASGPGALQGPLYGTTSNQGDGEACDCGTIFKLELGSLSAQR